MSDSRATFDWYNDRHHHRAVGKQGQTADFLLTARRDAAVVVCDGS